MARNGTTPRPEGVAAGDEAISRERLAAAGERGGPNVLARLQAAGPTHDIGQTGALNALPSEKRLKKSSLHTTGRGTVLEGKEIPINPGAAQGIPSTNPMFEAIRKFLSNAPAGTEPP